MAKLTITDATGKERIHELVDEITTIGRASGNVLQVLDEKASRHHFRVERAGERFRLVDLGSTNGTRLNGARLQGEVLLRSGDKICLGKTIFLFDDPNAPAPVTESKPAAEEAKPAAPKEEAKPKDELKLKASSGSALSVELDGPKYVLKMIEGPNPGQVFEVGPKPVTMGRHASNTIQINDDAASNYHAEISREPIGYVVTDLGSTNGTRVKPRNKSDFEKIVKTPLSVGMRIKIGKTVLEFENIGRAMPDEALFGTVELDAERLEAKLAEPSRGIPMPVLVAVAALVFIGVVVGVVWGVDAVARLVKGPGTPPPIPGKPDPKVVDTSNRVLNGDFAEGTDDEGNPKNFRIERGTPGVKVEVAADADRNAEGQNRRGLRVNKAGKSVSAMTVVETGTSFAVDAGKVYKLSGWMKNDGDGLFGLHVTWMQGQGDRKLNDNPVVLKETQEWKEKSVLLTPPPWAQRAKAGVFVQGKEGTACFDELSFAEEPGAAAAQLPSVRFGSVGLTFEGTKGAFTGMLGGEPVIEDGSLVLVTPDGSAVSDLTSAMDPRAKAERTSVAFDGRIYDFALQELTNYRLHAQQGAQGVELKAAVDTPGETGSVPQLRFYVVGPVASGDIEAAKPDNSSETVQGMEGSKSLSGVRELLFNAGKAPQLDLVFASPVDVELKREGNRRAVQIRFKGEVQVALAPESMGQKLQMLAAVADLGKLMDAKKWGEAEEKVKTLRTDFGGRFPQARVEAGRVQGILDSEWRKGQDEIRIAIGVVQVTPTAEQAAVAKGIIARHRQYWAGNAQRQQQLSETEKLIDNTVAAQSDKKTEAEADRLLKQAEEYWIRNVFVVSRSLLERIVRDFPETKAAKRAKELLPQVEAKERRSQELRVIEDRLQRKANNYLVLKDYKGAIDAVEKDKEFQDNKNDLPSLRQALDDWKKKAQ